MSTAPGKADHSNDNVTGLILAGGLARRMGNVDKGLELFRGKRLVDHVYERLAPQVGGVIISANQNHDAYKTFGVRVVSDAIGNFAGPLAGLHAGLSVSRRPYLASVPCDSPFLPDDLVRRLMTRLEESGADLAVDKIGKQPYTALCLVRRRPLAPRNGVAAGAGRLRCPVADPGLGRGGERRGGRRDTSGRNRPEAVPRGQVGVASA